MKKEVIKSAEEPVEQTAPTACPKLEIIHSLLPEPAGECQMCDSIEAEVDAILEKASRNEIDNSLDAHVALEAFVVKADFEAIRKGLRLVDSHIELTYEDADGNEFGAAFGLGTNSNH